MVHRILVGAAGFIGRPLASHLAEQPGELLLVDSALPSEFPEATGPVGGLVLHRVEEPTGMFTTASPP